MYVQVATIAPHYLKNSDINMPGHLLGPDNLQPFGRVDEVRGIRLRAELSDVRLLDKPVETYKN
jgi:hypothetical protein